MWWIKRKMNCMSEFVLMIFWKIRTGPKACQKIDKPANRDKNLLAGLFTLKKWLI